MADDMSLDLHSDVDASQTPRAEVTTSGGITYVKLPYPVFFRAKTPHDGRTHTFFTDEGEVHEGQRVIIVGHNGKREEMSGTIQRADQSHTNKWFVQTLAIPRIAEV